MCGGWRALLPGPDPDDQVLRGAHRRGSSRPARSRSPTWPRTTSGAPTCSTSARARSRRAGSSASSARFRPSGTASRRAFATSGSSTRDPARPMRRAAAPRTERDLSMKFVGIGIIVLIAGIVAAPKLLDAGFGVKLVAAVLIVVFGFLFVTVSSRLTGEIGSSSNPISGMTIATLLLTCLIFLIVGWTGSAYYVTGALGRGHRLHRGVQRRKHLPGPEDRVHPRCDAQVPADRHPLRVLRLRPGPRAAAPCAQQRQGRLCAHQGGRPRGAPRGRERALGEAREAVRAPVGRRPEQLPRLAQERSRRRRVREVPRGLEGRRRLARRPGHQRNPHPPARRIIRAQVLRAEGDPDFLHHQGDPRAYAFPGRSSSWGS